MTSEMPRLDPDKDLVAYFCAEYGIDERLPIYSGGLGVLAGDHLKTANDLSLPLVAVGLLYEEGYLRQRIDGDGRQHADPDPVEPERFGLSLARDLRGRELRVHVPLEHHMLHVRIWRGGVGSIPLILLDTRCPENRSEDQGIAARLYGGDHTTRLQQEVVLGIGGVRALRALGLEPSVWHLNEGHAAFTILERVREHVAEGLDFSAAVECVASNTVFTTHTPVPAGHDVFNLGHLRHWLGDYLGSLHTTERRLRALGAIPHKPDAFSMTALALRGSRYCNAVSRVHRDVAAQAESYAWPAIPPEENPVRFVANAVHLPTFLAAEWQQDFDQLLPDWRSRVLQPANCDWIGELSDGDFLRRRMPPKTRLLEDLRLRLGEQHRRNGVAPDIAEASLQRLQLPPEKLLVCGFARRFATYKRATLLLGDAQRLARLLGDDARPVVIVFAGKAHPHDGGGQQMIAELYHASLRPEFLGKLIVVEGYDLALGRSLTQGCDVWLNNPEYPLEASGTSGMKSAVNGGINVSILDGWWSDGCDGRNGVGIAPRTDLEGPARYHAEAEAMFDALEQQVVPRYFEAPAEWLQMCRHAMQTLIPLYGGARMLADYVRGFYAPATDHGRRLRERNRRNAVEFARWKRMIASAWDGLRADITSCSPLQATITLNGLPALDLHVEAHWPGGNGALRLDREENGVAYFVLDNGMPTEGGCELRVRPTHPLLAHPFEMGVQLRVALPR
ncbi:MAG: alpha-glucan family phosphorylase [Gammaproteobacteria bacterium]